MRVRVWWGLRCWPFFGKMVGDQDGSVVCWLGRLNIAFIFPGGRNGYKKT